MVSCKTAKGTVMADQPKTMTVPEAGKEYFGLSRNAAYTAAKNGDIPTIKIGKLLRVPVRALEEMLNAASR
jgi:Helix-turn-helix domain